MTVVYPGRLVTGRRLREFLGGSQRVYVSSN